MEPSAARDLIADQLRQDGFAVQQVAVSDTEAIVARRAQWRSTIKQHEFVVVFTVDGLTGQEAERLANAAQSYAIEHKGGLPGGMNTGTATTAVFLDKDPQESAVAWVDQSPIHRRGRCGSPS